MSASDVFGSSVVESGLGAASNGAASAGPEKAGRPAIKPSEAAPARNSRRRKYTSRGVISEGVMSAGRPIDIGYPPWLRWATDIHSYAAARHPVTSPDADVTRRECGSVGWIERSEHPTRCWYPPVLRLRFA